MKTKRTTYLIATLLVAVLLAGTVLALPDNAPTASISANPYDAENTAVITAVSIDTLANAGIKTITLYEDGHSIGTKNCNLYSSCVFVKTIVHNFQGSHTYYSIAEDKAGQKTRSNTITVNFNGVNNAPIIDSFTPTDTSPEAPENQGIDFTVSAHDPDNDPLTYEWRVDNALQPETSSSFHLQRSITQDTSYVVSVKVWDDKNLFDSQVWMATLTDVPTSIDLEGDVLLSECEEGTYTVTVDTVAGVTDVHWNWGDGSTESTGTGLTATHQFPEDGQYNVTVTVTDGDNQQYTDTLTVEVTDVAPQVTIIAPDESPLGDLVDFNADVIPPCNDALVSYEWDFGDGTPNVTGPTPVPNTPHMYMQAGVYTVTLTVYDDDGFGQDTHVINITTSGPTADFTYDPADPEEGDNVTFTDNSTTDDPNDPITDWEWDFDGDGQTDSYEQNPTHEFDQEGNYTVTLTVSNSRGSDSKTVTIVVGNNAPVASLSATPTGGEEPLDVHLECNVTGGNEPMDYVIDFGDGSPLYNGAVADHTYQQNNTYTATCTVTDNDGDVDQDSVIITVDDSEPVIDFTWDPANPVEGDQVDFDATIDAHDQPVSIDWDFGDGSAHPTGEDPSHTFATEGDYNVTLTVTDSDGSVTQVTHTVTIANNPPDAELMVDPDPAQGDEPLTVEFICLAYDGNEPLTYVLDFGDGTYVGVTPGNPVQHTYTQNGTYQAFCNVTDADGDTDLDSEIVTVFDTEPDVEWTWDPTAPNEHEPVFFNSTVSGYDQPLTISWDFGDGSSGSSDEDPTHVFDAAGQYTVTLTVTDSDGSVVSVTHTIDVGVNAPDVTLNADPLQGPEGVNVTFDCSWTDGDAPFSWYIDFGDGSASVHDTNPVSHVYGVQGSYTATCHVDDTDGDYGEDQVVINIDNNVPDMTLQVNPENGTEPLTVSAVCGVVDGNGPFDYTITWGDGDMLVGDDEAPTFGGTHNYTNDGNYTITCNVIDADGDQAQQSVDVQVFDSEPTASFTYSPTDPVEGDQVDFDATIDGYDQPLTILWNFGDGSTSNEEDPSYTYALAGDYNVTLTVTDSDGSSVTAWAVVSVGENAPFVNLDATPLSGPEGTNVSFTCAYVGGNEPVQVELDMDGDGVTDSNNLEDSMVFTVPGTYQATCTVTDADGDSDSDSVVINIANNPPVIDSFNATPNPTTEGQDVDFDCQVSGGDEPLVYQIDFGDGTLVGSNPQETHAYTNEGNYTASCLVTDADGDFDYQEQVIEVTNNPPVVNLAANVTQGNEPLSVEFTCSAGNGNEPFTYDVDFDGDGVWDVVGDTNNVWTHDYGYNPGIYNAQCRVTDVDGDMGTAVLPITVFDYVPTITNYAVDPTQGTEGDTVSFDCQTTRGNEPLSYVIDFGDGTQTASSSASHTYPLEGNYTTSCTVTDADGDSDYAEQVVNITNNVPVVNLHANVTSGDEPLSVEFTCDVGGGNGPLSYDVDFDGDGVWDVVGDTNNVWTHDYGYNPGVYAARCRVTDADNDVGSDTEQITVLDNAPVITSWTGTPNPATEGDIVSFDCQTTGGNDPLIYVINFGDGQSSSDPQDSHTYNVEGLYNATCSVSDADGDSDASWFIVNVTNNAPVVNLAANTTSGDEPLSVEFNCYVGGGNAPFSYQIDFDDGTAPVNADHAVHTYSTPGVYNATCTVTDTDGDVGSNERQISVAQNAPVVDLVVTPNSGVEGDSLDFDCQVTGGNAPLTYLITFGDGSSTTSPQASHTYTLEGNYSATCTVTDADADIGSDTEIVPIGNNPPVANLITNVSQAEEPQSVEFNCTVGGGNAPFDVWIDFGDGSASVNTDYAVHTYSQQGEYLPTCTVTDTDGDVDVDDNQLVNITDSVPTAAFNYTSPVTEGAPTSFFDQSTSYDGITSWEWDFESDGTVDSTAQNPTHVFTTDGNYLVTLTVTDADGSTDSYSELVVVQNNAPVIELTVVPDSGSEPLTATVTCTVTSGGNAPFTYLVLYGDGSSTTNTFSTHTYDQDGIYGAMCQVTDADGDVAVDTATVNVTDTEPTADFNFTPQNPGTGDTVSFTDLSTAYDGITSWAWDFDNDGTVDSTEQNPTHVYNLAGNYQVNLTVTDGDGSTAWTVKTISVNATPAAPMILNIQVIDITNVSANITWATDQLADSLLEWGTTPSLGSSMFDGTFVYNHSMQLTGLTPNTTYYFNITSCNSLGNCTTSGPNTFTTLAADAVPPAQVTGLAESSVGDDWIQWAWTNPSDADFDHVEVWVNGSWYANVSGTPGGSGSVNVTGLANGTTYTVEVITVDTDGNRNTPGQTDDATTTGGTGPDVTPPTVGLVAPSDGSTDTDGNVTIMYTVSDDQAATLTCDVWSNTSGAWAIDAAGQSTTNGGSNTNDYTGLADGTYRWNVECSDGTNSAWASADFTFEVNTSSGGSGSAPSVVAWADDLNGNAPHTVNFDAVVTGGDAPLSYAWDFDNDGTTDSTQKSPTYIYNNPGTYNATVQVCDADMDCDSDYVTIVVGSSANRDIAVLSMTNNKTGTTTYLWDDVGVNATVQNQGDVTEFVSVELLVDGTVTDTQVVSIDPGMSQVVTFNWASASPDGWRNLEVRAVPVTGESDLSDQSQSDNIRVWPVDTVPSGNYVVANSTREIFLDKVSASPGDTFNAYLPIQNQMAMEDFYDLRVELSYNDTAFSVGPSTVQYIDLGADSLEVVQWTVTVLPGANGNYAFSAALGNNEITPAEITAKLINIA